MENILRRNVQRYVSLDIQQCGKRSMKSYGSSWNIKRRSKMVKVLHLVDDAGPASIGCKIYRRSPSELEVAIASVHNGLELITELTIALNSGVRCSTDDDGMVVADGADEDGTVAIYVGDETGVDETVTVDDEEDSAVTNIQKESDDDESVDVCGSPVRTPGV